MSFFLWRLDYFISTLLTRKARVLFSVLLKYRPSGHVFCLSLCFLFLLPFFSYAGLERQATGDGSLPSSPSSGSRPLEGSSHFSSEPDAPKRVDSVDGITEETAVDITQRQGIDRSRNYSEDLEIRLNDASDTSSYIWNILRLIFSLTFVLLLAYAAIRLMRRGRLFVPNDDAYLKLVASLNIEQGRSIKVFTLGGKAYVIGVTATNITNIAEIEDQVLVDAMNLKADESSVVTSSFTKIFSNMFSSNRKAGQKKLEDVIFDDSFLKKQQERLNNINITEEKDIGENKE